MKKWLPVLFGFIGGSIIGVVSLFLSLGGLNLMQVLHDPIQQHFYPNQDPMLWGIFDPLVFIASFGAVGMAMGLLWKLVREITESTRGYRHHR